MRNQILHNEKGNHDPSENTLQILKDYFPQCFSRDGKFLIEKFKEELQGTDISYESFSLNWLGKTYAKIIADLETETIVAPDLEHNGKEENYHSENVYLTGDNLDVLKHLTSAYAEKVSTIYIDPPYNTGQDDFIYQDNFKFTPEKLSELANISKEEAVRILDFTERKSNSHSAWLTFMYPRLFIARELLRDDGVIFISIDDNEQANLKVLCDEVFSEENFITQFIWKNKSGGGNDSTYVAIEHEYVIAYAKSKADLPPLFEKYEEEYLKRYKEEDEIGKFYWDTLKRKSGKQYYPIECPDGTILEKDEYGNPISWLRSEKTFLQNKVDGEVRFVKTRDDKWSVQFKQRLPKGKKPRSIYFDDTVIVDKGKTQDGSDELLQLFKRDIFDNPKPVELVKYLISIIADKDDIVLDFFSGSATTAQAVMELNADDEKARKYIVVQLPENLDESVKSKSGDKKRNLERAIDFLDSINKP
ncbi:site-specific DNA-methyltransferase, partial [Virgibacillus sp. FSP13]